MQKSVALPGEEQHAAPGNEWWRSAVIYQIYPRSFADASGDGIGDLPGITSRMDSLQDLGIDAIWLSPFMTSPQKDAGYDVANYRDVDPIFGTLADFDEMLKAAHDRGIRVIVDLVPNHSSDQHEWFQAALAAEPGSPERARYIFRDGKGENGDEAPNNWESVFGGPAWTRTTNADGTPGQWYLHLFDSSQPDFDWSNPEVQEEFRGVLRFWLDRGADGFRVDVAHGLVKEDGLPDLADGPGEQSMGSHADLAPYWGQEGVHEIYRDWHKVLAEYEGDRVPCAEAWLPTTELTAQWVRPDEMHQAFNFGYLTTPWDTDALKGVIHESLDEFGKVGAPSTWVLSNHDVIRHVTRLSLTEKTPQDHGIGPKSKARPLSPEVSAARGRAATTLMLSLPGSSYIYQGEELGLPEDVNVPDEARQDPAYFRTNGERYGRDGCRVPLPWEPNKPAYGFSPTGESWLPQPSDWDQYARSVEDGVEGSSLELYKQLLRERKARSLGTGSLVWEEAPADAVAFRRGDLHVIANLGASAVDLPEGAKVVLSSQPLDGASVPTDTTVWYEL